MRNTNPVAACMPGVNSRMLMRPGACAADVWGGAVTDAQIAQQLTVLNNAWAPLQVRRVTYCSGQVLAPNWDRLGAC